MTNWDDVFSRLGPDPSPEALAELEAAYMSDRAAGSVGATTPVSNLPYPLSTDPVAQGASAIQALATQLDVAPVANIVAAAGSADTPAGTYFVTNFGTISAPVAGYYTGATDGINILQTGKYIAYTSLTATYLNTVNAWQTNIVVGGTTANGTSYVSASGISVRGTAVLIFSLGTAPYKLQAQMICAASFRFGGGTLRVLRVN